MKKIYGSVLCAFALAAPPTGAEECPVFLLQHGDGGVVLVRESIPGGETRVWPAGGDQQTIDVVLPVGPGTSGGLVRGSERMLHAVRCTGLALEHRVRGVDGSEQARPPRDLEALRSEDIRLSVVDAVGQGRVFRIAGYDTVMADEGPAQNLLAQVPMELTAGDVFVTTETSRRWQGESVVGQTAFTTDRYLFAWGGIPDGGDGWLVVDTGGAQTLLVRGMLPPGVEIEEATMVEYSSAGKRLLPYAPGGATGSVSGILGHVTLARLVVGELEFVDVAAAVIEELPELFGRPVVGILGLDLLRRSDRLVLELPAAGRGQGRLVLERRPEPAQEETGGIPFAIVNEHLVLPARLGERPLHLILDTGAPGLLLDEAAVGADFAWDDSSPSTLRGLDGGMAAGRQGTAPLLTVGTETIRDVSVMVASLPVFGTLRTAEQRIGLLGNAVLGRYARIEIDWRNQVLRLVPRDAESSSW